VHAYHGKDIGILFLQLSQLRKYVHAVNSAVRPEMKDDEPAFEIGHADWREGVDPLELLRKPGSVNRPFVSFRQCVALRTAVSL
jgi:hypothetical protein